MHRKVSDVIIVSFALFAMYLGAGNLIFPPTLGASAGDQWFLAALGFLIIEIGLIAFGLFAVTRLKGDVQRFSDGLPSWTSTALVTATALILGPLFASPRTAATTFEVAILPVAEKSFSGYGILITNIIVNFAFFATMLIFIISPNNIMDKVGKLLTPFLLFILALLILKGVLSPLGKIPAAQTAENVFALGVREGYQTMDGLGTMLFGMMLINTMREKSYPEGKVILTMSLLSIIGASIGLALVYMGLTFLGASSASLIPMSASRTERLVLLANELWGPIGSVVLGFSIALACLTTAIGLLSPISEFFSKKLKISFKLTATVLTALSFFMSIIGVDGIIRIAGPVLELIYPIMIVLIFISFFSDILPNYWFKRGAVIATVSTGIMLTLLACDSSLGTNFKATFIKSIIDFLPFSNLGFAWLVPAVLCGLVCGFIASFLGKSKER